MSDDELRSQFYETMHLIVFSLTRLNYLEQLVKLANDKNSIIFSHEGFFAMAQRDMGSSAVLSARKLVESRDDTHNLYILIDAIKKTETYKENPLPFNDVFRKIQVLAKSETAKKAQIISSVKFAHSSLRLPKNTIVLRHGYLKKWFESVGSRLNELSGLLWNTETLLFDPESEDGRMQDGFTDMERTELIGYMIMTNNPEHPAIEKANEVLHSLKSGVK